MIPKYLLSALTAASAGVANYIVTTPAQMVSAAASATTGQIIEVRANIAASVTATLLTFQPGVTIRTDGTNRTISGYAALFDCNGNYTPCVIDTGIIWNGTGVNPSSAYSGTITCKYGYLKFKGTCFGNNGATASTRPADNIVGLADATRKCIVECIGATVYGSASDNVSGFLSGTGTTVAAGSMIIGTNSTCYSPGAGGSDNCWTGHDGFEVYVYGGTMGPGGGGPMINCAPATSRAEMWGVTLDMTGASSSSNDLHCTLAVGCKAINNSANVRQIILHGDSTNTTVPSIGAFNENINVVMYNDHTVTPYILRNTNTQNGSWFGSYQSLSQSKGFISAQNNIVGTATTNGNTVWIYGSTTMYNDTIDVGSASGATYPVRVLSPSTGTATHYAYSLRINASQNAFLARATRSDAVNQILNLKDVQSKATTAVGFNTLNTDYTATNCTIDNSTPSGASTGYQNACSELQATSWYAGLVAYAATVPAAGAGNWPTDLRSRMGV